MNHGGVATVQLGESALIAARGRANELMERGGHVINTGRWRSENR
jgi:hypothetical protein